MPYKSINEANLKSRITATLARYQSNEIAAIMWKGYITGLYSHAWKHYSDEDHDLMKSLLPGAGDEEKFVYLSDVITIEERQEAIADYKEQMAEIARKGRRK